VGGAMRPALLTGIRGPDRSASGKRNKCRRPSSEASYAAFALARREGGGGLDAGCWMVMRKDRLEACHTHRQDACVMLARREGGGRNVPDPTVRGPHRTAHAMPGHGNHPRFLERRTAENWSHHFADAATPFPCDGTCLGAAAGNCGDACPPASDLEGGGCGLGTPGRESGEAASWDRPCDCPGSWDGGGHGLHAARKTPGDAAGAGQTRARRASRLPARSDCSGRKPCGAAQLRYSGPWTAPREQGAGRGSIQAKPRQTVAIRGGENRGRQDAGAPSGCGGNGKMGRRGDAERILAGRTPRGTSALPAVREGMKVGQDCPALLTETLGPDRGASAKRKLYASV
jgi:hypothetical protein